MTGESLTAEASAQAASRRFDGDATKSVDLSDSDDVGVHAPDYHRRTSRALNIIVVILGIHLLYLGRSLLMPIVIAFVGAFLLRPIVRKLARWRIPESVGAGIVLFSAVALIVLGVVKLTDPAIVWLARAPIDLRLRQVQRKLEPVQGRISDIAEASEKIEKLASDSSTGSGAPEQVQIRQPSIASSVMSTTTQFLAGAALCFVLTYFVLAMGDSFLNSVVQLIPRMREKKEAVLLVRNVERGISSYLLTVALINACLGLVIGVSCWLAGLPNAALWGVMAMLLNYVPYAGAFLGSGVVLVVGLFAFDTIGAALVAPAAYFTINIIEGNFLTPAVIGRSMSLNPIMVFLSLAFWGWMWGVCGALLAVPLLAIARIACDQFDSTRPFSILVSHSTTIGQ